MNIYNHKDFMNNMTRLKELSDKGEINILGMRSFDSSDNVILCNDVKPHLMEITISPGYLKGIPRGNPHGHLTKKKGPS
ncbi:unnamed protein product [marine sediment metagenome]|uniref:Uncharacterized protein n=1 Tax=marine sediment metagenome TaxID=412755 RepID=X1TUN6_9ZZZZ